MCLALVVVWCESTHAKVERKDHTGITYKEAVKAGRKSLNKSEKKSIRQIIQEILERHKRMEYLPAPTYPIPLYDSITWEELKNVA